MAQGVLAFQYAAERKSSGLTGFAGLEIYLELIKASGLGAAVRRHVRVAGSQGWLDAQMIVALLALNLCGGARVSDLEQLEADPGLGGTIGQLEAGQPGALGLLAAPDAAAGGDLGHGSHPGREPQALRALLR